MMRNPTAHSRKRNKWYVLMISSLGPTKQNTLPFKVETNELNLCFRKFGIFGQKHLKHCVFWLFYLLQLSNSSISKIQPKIHFLSGPWTHLCVFFKVSFSFVCYYFSAGSVSFLEGKYPVLDLSASWNWKLKLRGPNSRSRPEATKQIRHRERSILKNWTHRKLPDGKTTWCSCCREI